MPRTLYNTGYAVKSVGLPLSAPSHVGVPKGQCRCLERARGLAQFQRQAKQLGWPRLVVIPKWSQVCAGQGASGRAVSSQLGVGLLPYLCQTRAFDSFDSKNLEKRGKESYATLRLHWPREKPPCVFLRLQFLRFEKKTRARPRAARRLRLLAAGERMTRGDNDPWY